MTSETVRLAAATLDMNHRDPRFVEALRQTKGLLLRVYPQLLEGSFGWPGRTQEQPLRTGHGVWRPYIIGGSGTAAVEAMITSCVSEGPVLLIDSGYYSGRVRAKLEAHDIPYEAYRTGEWRTAPDLKRIAEMLRSPRNAEPRFEAVITTHNETTTGRLNPLPELGSLCTKSRTKLLVDAMSSFGADPIDFTDVDAVAASANKCLHGLPGVSFVLVRDWLADEMKAYAQRTVYLSLPLYEGDAPPLTPPVPILFAFKQALIELGAGGAATRREVYLDRAKTLRAGLAARGFEFAIEPESMSCTLTTASIPRGWSAEAWFDANLEAGFMIYATKGPLRDHWFQVANMGELTDATLLLWLGAVDDLLAQR